MSGSERDWGTDRTAWFAENFRGLANNIGLFIQGKTDVVAQALTCLFAEGHLLIEDVPGVGKTSLAKAIALSIDGTLQRIQFTPDLLPSDVTGVQIYNTSSHTFEFHPGAVFANVVVADEINRASPKTQSALLEVMEEQQVTVDAKAYPVPRPFIVIATQNPIEHDGTYRLPEAQLDRFMMRIGMGYAPREAEVDVIMNRARGHTVDDIMAVISADQVGTMIKVARETHVSPQISGYIVDLVAATRNLRELRLGVSSRGGLALVLASQVHAAAQNRSFVTADDVKVLAHSVLNHRMLLAPEAELQGVTVDRLVDRLLGEVPVPLQTQSPVTVG
jgi:MoxR-like ATPase